MRDTPDILNEYGFFTEQSRILDIGCGVGFIPSWCKEHEKNVDYLGVDVREASIIACKMKHLGSNYEFTHINVYNDSYNPNGNVSPSEMTLPCADNSMDSVICHSLFTHLGTERVAERYIDEIMRVMKVGGLLWTTWFTAPPNDVSISTIRTVYSNEFVMSMIKRFEFIYSTGGTTDRYHDQYQIALRKM